MTSPDLPKTSDGRMGWLWRIVSCWSRRIETPVGGVCFQYFIRIHRITVGFGWVTRYKCVPNFLMLTRRSNETSEVLEFHLWRVRFGAQWPANPKDEPRP